MTEQEPPVSRGTKANTVAIKERDEFGKTGRHTNQQRYSCSICFGIKLAPAKGHKGAGGNPRCPWRKGREAKGFIQHHNNIKSSVFRRFPKHLTLDPLNLFPLPVYLCTDGNTVTQSWPFLYLWSAVLKCPPQGCILLLPTCLTHQLQHSPTSYQKELTFRIRGFFRSLTVGALPWEMRKETGDAKRRREPLNPVFTPLHCAADIL